MKKLLTTLALSATVITSAQASGTRTYHVTVTNASAYHVLTPAFIATHNSHYQLFQIGSKASNALAVQAESGDPSLVAADASGADGVSSVTTGGLIPPATSETFVITAGKKEMLTYSAMLAGTNDAFASISVKLPKKSATYAAYTYDAGSETNNEDCVDIPGPPCGGANVDNGDGEGFVTIHNGVHGIGDLLPEDSDWRGPVAIIKIERVDD